jgi:hypothetical protein
VAYPYEFWHYSRGDLFQQILDPEHPDSRYAPVDFDGASGRTREIGDLLAPLHSLAELEGTIRHALEKIEEERS